MTPLQKASARAGRLMAMRRAHKDGVTAPKSSGVFAYGKPAGLPAKPEPVKVVDRSKTVAANFARAMLGL